MAQTLKNSLTLTGGTGITLSNSGVGFDGTLPIDQNITVGNDIRTTGDVQFNAVTSSGYDLSGYTLLADRWTSDFTAGGTIRVTGDLTIPGNASVGVKVTAEKITSELTSSGTIFASGSTSDTDGGIIVQNAASAGYALGYDSGVDRWAFDADLAHNATNLVPDAYVGVIQTGTTHGDSVAVPTYGGATNGVGTIYVDTDDNEIWIYA